MKLSNDKENYCCLKYSIICDNESRAEIKSIISIIIIHFPYYARRGLWNSNH